MIVLIFRTVCCLVLVLSGTAHSRPFYKKNNKTVELKDLPPGLRASLHEAEKSLFYTQKSLVEEHILDEYYASQAKAKKLSKQAYKEKTLKISQPSEKQLKVFYEENKKDIPYPFEVVKEKLKNFYQSKKSREMRESNLRKAVKAKKIIWLMSEPQTETLDLKLEGYAAKGAKNAKLTVVEFADYQCPHCQHANQMMTEVLKKMGKQIHYVFIDYPLNSSGVSRNVARMAYCVRKHKGEASYWEFHNTSFAKQSELPSPGRLVAIAKETKSWSKEVESCSQAVESKNFVDASESYASYLGVKSTPTFFINGKRTSLPENPQAAMKKLKGFL